MELRGTCLGLFDGAEIASQGGAEGVEIIVPGARILRRFVEAADTLILQALAHIEARAPYRNMSTPGGYPMSVAMTNCGALGWVSDADGYRYTAIDPLSGERWPTMPTAFTALAQNAAATAGFPGFMPDTCLINCYRPGSRLSLHQDKDEKDFSAPIVSVSLGLPATFLFGGATRTECVKRFALFHGDVVVWGGPARKYFHGIAPLADGMHPQLGRQRINLTLRKSG